MININEIGGALNDINNAIFNCEMNIKNLKNEIEQLKKAKKEPPEPSPYGLWKPQYNDLYYKISYTEAEEHIEETHWWNDYIDEFLYSIGNCFKTKEQAGKHLEHLKVETQLRDIAERLNKGREIDFYELLPSKYFLYYDFANGKIKQWDYAHDKMQGTIYCLDENFQDVAIQEIGEERLTEYLKEC